MGKNEKHYWRRDGKIRRREGKRRWPPLPPPRRITHTRTTGARAGARTDGRTDGRAGRRRCVRADCRVRATVGSDQSAFVRRPCAASAPVTRSESRPRACCAHRSRRTRPCSVFLLLFFFFKFFFLFAPVPRARARAPGPRPVEQQIFFAKYFCNFSLLTPVRGHEPNDSDDRPMPPQPRSSPVDRDPMRRPARYGRPPDPPNGAVVNIARRRYT